MEKSFMSQEDFEAGKAIDQTALISDLSHQLEEARTRIEKLEGINREWAERQARLAGARDALKELLVEMMGRGVTLK